jgi:hypothetical protein
MVEDNPWGGIAQSKLIKPPSHRGHGDKRKIFIRKPGNQEKEKEKIMPTHPFLHSWLPY